MIDIEKLPVKCIVHKGRTIRYVEYGDLRALLDGKVVTSKDATQGAINIGAGALQESRIQGMDDKVAVRHIFWHMVFAIEQGFKTYEEAMLKAEG